MALGNDCRERRGRRKDAMHTCESTHKLHYSGSETAYCDCEPQKRRREGKVRGYHRILQRSAKKMVGTWLREIFSCSCLTLLPGRAWVLLSKSCRLFILSCPELSHISPDKNQKTVLKDGETRSGIQHLRGPHYGDYLEYKVNQKEMSFKLRQQLFKGSFMNVSKALNFAKMQ